MGVVDRLARRVMDDPIALDADTIAARVRQLAPVEAPLLDGDPATCVVDAVLGLGPLEQLMRDSAVSDIFVNGDGRIWVERGGNLERSEVSFGTAIDLTSAIERVVAPLGLRLDRASPAVDARLPDGSRLHAIVPPASIDGPVVAIRRFTEAAKSLGQLIELGSIDEDGATLLQHLVLDRQNILVCGSTGSGKTTLLNVLSREIPDDERVVTVEDAAELRLSGHVVRLEGRPANSEGVGAITLRQLLRHALRLRPDRLVIGEVRGAEAFDMLQALSTGHEGSMSTIHASSPDEALWRLETLARLDSHLAVDSLNRQVRRVVDAVVVVGRQRGRRVVRGIHMVDPDPVAVYECS